MDKNTIKGLKMIQEGISLILSNAEQEASVPVEAVEETAVETKTTKKTAPKAKTVKSTEVEAKSTSSEYTQEELDSMTYNDLKKLAKELGITAVGNRKEITAKILSGRFSAENDEPEETEEEKSSKKAVAPKSKSVKKSAPPVEEDDDDDDDNDEEFEDIEDDEEEDDVDPVEQQVHEVAEGMEDDEIRNLLSEVGISTKGKRQALISKLVQAVKDGKLELDNNDSDEEEDEDDSADESVEDSDDEDVTEGMNKKRKKAYIQFCKETEEAFNNGEITRKGMIKFINDFNDTEDKMKGVSDKDILNTYLRLASNLVSDDGKIVEDGAYTVNDEPYCCGKPLKYDEDENMFICETCGAEYEGEE